MPPLRLFDIATLLRPFAKVREAEIRKLGYEGDPLNHICASAHAPAPSQPLRRFARHNNYAAARAADRTCAACVILRRCCARARAPARSLIMRKC